MIKAVFEDGMIVPTDPVPAEWSDGRELQIVELPANEAARMQQLDEWYRDTQQLAAELDDPAEWQTLDAALEDADRAAKEMTRREMGLA